MKISVPKESVDSETRVAVTPYSVSELTKLDWEISAWKPASSEHKSSIMLLIAHVLHSYCSTLRSYGYPASRY